MLPLLVVAVVLSISACSSTCPEDVSPFSDDPEGVRQWHMPALGVSEAWDVQRGRPEVVVAVVDNGFELDHPDLAGQLWINTDESSNGVDDDGNGYIDDIHGWDFLDRDGDPNLPANSDLEPRRLGHGTAAAGVIAAQTDNEIGVAGCCPGCRLMLLRGRDFQTAHNVMPVLAEAIRYAADNGAQVISVSDGVPADDVDPTVEADVTAAIELARDSGVIVVVSAGNDGSAGLRWPGLLDPVIGVASVNPENIPSSWTSYGPEVDVAAPGECIYTTRTGGSYGYFSGTSASAPIVAGLAALLKSEHPTWSADELVEHIRSTATPASFDGRSDVEGQLGAGVVSFAGAL